MAYVYILYSNQTKHYYIGSCINLELRVSEHLNKKYEDAYTKIANDWTLFYSMKDLSFGQARKIESHIKRMKSKKFIENLKTYIEISDKLKKIYCE
jgi:putative endonuclease